MGITFADKPYLVDAKSKGANWIANDADGSTYWYTDEPVRLVGHIGKWDNPTGEYGRVKRDLKIGYEHALNIDLAIAQIADMERIEGFEEMLKTGDETTKAALFPSYFAAKANEQKPITNQESILKKWMNPANLARRLVSYDEDSMDWIVVNGNGCVIIHKPKCDDAIQAAIEWLLSEA